MNHPYQTIKSKTLSLKINSGKTQRRGEIDPAFNVVPDAELCSGLGSLRWLNFPIPVGLPARSQVHVKNFFKTL